MLLAAGRGTRMRPLTDSTAKPLLQLAGRTLLDHALDRLAAAGVTRVVVNAHWCADEVAAHLASRAMPPETVLRPEARLLGAAGAIHAALGQGMLGPEPFFVVNGDSFWLDGPMPALAGLAKAFDPTAADGALLLHRVVHVQAETGMGDFLLDPWGQARRPAERQQAPYVYAGIQLAVPALFAGGAASSMAVLWDRAIAAGRLRGLVHDGLWFHLSTPADLAAAESNLRPWAVGHSR